MSPITPAVERALALAAEQYGLLTAKQCRDAGVSRNTVQRLVHQGAWTLEAPGLYRLVDAPRSWRGRALGAALACGADAVVSHRSAAHLWGLAGFWPTPDIAVTVARNRRPRPRPGVEVHETANPKLLGATVHLGVPVTGPERTFLDLAAVGAGDDELVRARTEILRLGLATPVDLWAVLAAHHRPGRRGIGRARAVLRRAVRP
jgi:predicted transcriptional regulator of viral defense system